MLPCSVDPTRLPSPSLPPPHRSWHTPMENSNQSQPPRHPLIPRSLSGASPSFSLVAIVCCSPSRCLPLPVPVSASVPVSVCVPVSVPLHIDMFRSHFGPHHTHSPCPTTAYPENHQQSWTKSCPRCPLCKIFYLHIFLILILHCILFGLGDLSQPPTHPLTPTIPLLSS